MSRDIEVANLRATISLDSKNFKNQVSSVNKEVSGLKTSFDIATKAIDSAENKFDAISSAIEKGEMAIESMNKKLNIQKRAYDDLKNTIKEQQATYDNLQNTLKQAENKLALLNSQTNKNVEEIKAQEKVISDLRQELEKKANVIDKNINKLQTYSNNIGKTENEINKFTDKVSKLKSNLDDLKVNNATNDLNKFSNKLKDIANEIKNTSDKIKNLGDGIGELADKTSGVSTAFAGFGTASVLAFTESDNAIGKIQASLGSTEEQAQKVLDRAKELSRDGFDLDESINGILKLEQSLGDLASNSEIDDLTRELQAMGEYFEVDMTEGVRTVTTMMKNFGITGQEATDIIAWGFQNGLNASGDWMDTLWEYSNQFSSLGFNAKDTLAIINAGMQDGAFNTDKLADGVKEFGIRLKEVGKDQESALSTLGLSVSEVTNAFNEGGEAGKNMALKVAMELSKVEDETTKNQLAVALFGTMYEDVGDAVVNSLNAVANSNIEVAGSADKVRQSYEETFGAQLKGKLQEFKEPLIQIGESMLPLVDTALELVSNFAEWFSTLDAGTVKAIGGFTVFVAGISPVLTAVSGLVKSTSFLTGTISSVVGKIGLFQSGATTLTPLLSTLAGPVGIGALVVALVGLATYIGDSSNAINFLQEKFGSFGTVLSGVCEFISGTVQMTFGNMVSWVQLAIDSIGAIIDGPGGATIEDAWKRHNERIIKNTEEGMSKLSLSTTRGISQMRNATDKELNGVINSFNTILSQVGTIAEGNYKKASSVISKELTNLSSNQITILKGMNDTTKQMFKGIQEGMSVEEASKKVEKNLKDMAKNGDIDIKELEKNINSAMDMVKSNLDTKSKEGADKLSSNIDKASKDFKSSVDTMANDASSGMSNVSSSFFDASGKIPPEIKKNMDQSVQSIKQAGSDMYNGVKTSFLKMDEVCKQHATNMYLGVKKSFTALSSSVTSLSSQMASKVISDWNRVKNAYSTPINAKINVTKTQTSRAISKQNINTPKSFNLENTLRTKAPKIEAYQISGGYYNLNNNIDNSLNIGKTLEKLFKLKPQSGGVTINLNIDNFNNNRKQDIEQLMEEITSITKRKTVLGGS